MRLSDFDYTLPQELIAQTPVEPRDAARLLVLDRKSGAIAHHHVHDLPDLLHAGDLIVANRSRVLPARIHGRLRGGGHAELLLLRRLSRGAWEALGRPARRLRPGDVVRVADDLDLTITAAHAEGLRHVEVHTSQQDPDAALLAAGSTPLPPYIRGWVGDAERYQTIFADADGSAAAPTAGLHVTPGFLARRTARARRVSTLGLHVGLATFRPISHDDQRAHRMHREWYGRGRPRHTRPDFDANCPKGVARVARRYQARRTSTGRSWPGVLVPLVLFVVTLAASGELQRVSFGPRTADTQFPAASMPTSTSAADSVGQDEQRLDLVAFEPRAVGDVTTSSVQVLPAGNVPDA